MTVGGRPLCGRDSAACGVGKAFQPSASQPSWNLLRVVRQRQRRARVALAARPLRGVRPGLPGDAECPLDAGVVGLQLVVGDRPVGERRSGQVADDSAQAEVVRREPGQPALPVHRPAADHLRHRAEQLDHRLGRASLRPHHGARVEQRVRPQVVAVDVGQLVAAEGLLRPPRAALQRHHAQAALGEHLRRGRAGGPGPDDADVGPLRLWLTRHARPPFRGSPVGRRTSRRRCNGRVCTSASDCGPGKPITCQPTRSRLPP